MKFKMTHLFTNSEPEFFTDKNAPDWLTSVSTIPGSTMDNRWFWNDSILKLGVGEYVNTDFRRIDRVE